MVTVRNFMVIVTGFRCWKFEGMLQICTQGFARLLLKLCSSAVSLIHASVGD